MARSSISRTIIWASLTFALAARADEVTYREAVAPILRQYCVGCHNGTEANGGLAMHTFADFAKGGENGPAFVPGKSGESKLYLLVAGMAEPKMPPEDNPVPSAEEIETLKRWIDAGAPAPPDPMELIVSDPTTPDIAPRVPVAPRIFSACYSPDGKRIALGSYQRVLVVDSTNGLIEQTLADLAGPITDVSITPDGARLITAGGIAGVRGEAVLWSIASAARERVFAGHQDSLYAARLSPDQQILATAGYDKLVMLWNGATGERLHELKGHNDIVTSLAFRPDGKVLASASGDRTVKLWQLPDGERLETFSESLKDLTSVLFSTTGDRVYAAGGDNRIRSWFVSLTAAEGTNRLLESRYAHESPILKLAISPDGTLLASAGSDRVVKLWRLPGVEELRVLEAQPDWPTALAFAPDNATLFVGRQSGTGAIYQVADGAKLRDIVPTEKPPPPPVLVRVLPVGATIGSTTRVELTGQNFAKVREVKFNHAGISAALVQEPAPTNERLSLDVTAAADVARGAYELRVVTPGGETAPLAVHVDELPSALESEPNGAGDPATPLSIPAVAWGTLSAAGDADRFQFEAKAGQQIVFDAVANAIGSPANLVVIVSDTEGRTLATTNDSLGQSDPLLAWTAPGDGAYVVEIHDLSFAGSDKHFYRLTVGPLPYVVGVHPMTLAAGSSTPVELLGPNVPPGSTAVVATANAGDVDVPIDPKQFRTRRLYRVAVVAKSVLEAEPNDDAARAGTVELPGEAAGRIERSGDMDLFRIHANEGESWIFEIDAARRGSALDSRLDVLDAKGNPIDRVWLAAVRDSHVEFRNIDSAQLEIRCKSWEEMELNEFMYMNGEVTRLFRHPRGPDSGFLFYSVSGQRQTYFDTSPTTHAVEDPVYIVRPLRPGTAVVPNGLPVFRLMYSNDDASDRRLGSDSRLTFTAPATADYLIRVSDVRSMNAPAMPYRLIVRKPQPGFRVRLADRGPNVPRGSGREVTFVCERMDDFEGAIDITVEGLPPGLSMSAPIRIEPGHESVSAVLRANADAAAPTPEQIAAVKLYATGIPGDASVTQEIEGFTALAIGEKPALVVRVEPTTMDLAAGATVAAKVIVERNGHNDRVTFEMPGLPHGVIVDNIGLNGILIPEGQNERGFFLTARPFVPETQRPFFARSNEAGAQSSAPVMLTIRRPGEGPATAERP